MANDRPLLLDVTRLIWRRWVGRLPTGIDRVCLAYLNQYRDIAQAVVQRGGFRRIVSVAASERLFEALLEPCKRLRPLLARILVSERMRAHALPGAGRLYLNVGHTALQDQAYLDWARAADVRPVYMVHDIIPITHPEYCRAGEAARHAQRVRNMLASSVGLIGNSQATLDSLIQFAAKEGMSVSATLPAALGTDIHAISSAPIQPTDRPTFVMLGTIEARKNHLMLLQIWARLVRDHGMDAPRLMIIGQRGWECEQVLDLLERSEILRGSVVETSNCGDAELETYLRSAKALLFPSLVEGYGLPLIEALASGTPVIASDLPVFHEIGAGVPDFLDPLDGPGWQQTIEAYSEPDSKARAAQMARLGTYNAPTWPCHFAKVSAWLETL